ncbi:hypothetical protein M2140_001949 [Clostridiales Family XIII bacterium PM5-7]
MFSDCILAADGGKCKGLTERHPLCGSKLCPFYKTEKEERISQDYCRRRLAALGVDFKTLYKLEKKGGK